MYKLYTTESRKNLSISFLVLLCVKKPFASVGVDISQPEQRQKKNEKSKVDSDFNALLDKNTSGFDHPHLPQLFADTKIFTLV